MASQSFQPHTRTIRALHAFKLARNELSWITELEACGDALAAGDRDAALRAWGGIPFGRMSSFNDSYPGPLPGEQWEHTIAVFEALCFSAQWHMNMLAK